MNQQLKRIENTLEQLGLAKSPPPRVSPRSDRKDPSFAITVKSFPNPKRFQQIKVPALPKVEAALDYPELVRNKNLNAMHLLKNIEAMIMGWQQELKQVVETIQAIYAEGPILDAWLDSNPVKGGKGQTKVRKATMDSLMGYVEEVTTENVSYQTPRDGYFLCGFDEAGEFWSRPCPSEQVASVSVAIARYQKLYELANQKSYLENRLNQLSETLAVINNNLQV